MQFILFTHVDETGWPQLTPAQQEQGLAAYAAFVRDLVDQGALVTSGRLEPSAGGRTVRVKDGRRQIVDGPFSETKEVLAGYFLIEAPDLDAATDWAARCPASGHGAVEVRALWKA